MKKFEYADFLRCLQQGEISVPKTISAQSGIRQLEMDSLETFEVLLTIEKTYNINIPFGAVKENMTINELVNEINKIVVNTAIVKS